MENLLIRNIPTLKETAGWVDNFFGGDHHQFVNYVKSNSSPETLTDKGLMICMGTARVIGRIIKIHSEQSLKDNNPVVLNPGEGAEKHAVFNVFFHEGRFRAMVDSEPIELLEEVSGMRGPSQTIAGKYRAHKARGPTLTVKAKGPNSKARKDEQRRRDEKAKSDAEIRMDALQHVNDSLKADAGELKDKIRNLQSYSETREKYIASLEMRFARLCDVCKAKVPEPAFSTTEQYTLAKIAMMMEEQKNTIANLEKRIEYGALRAPDTEKDKSLSVPNSSETGNQL